MIQKDRKDEKNRRNRHLPGLAILFVCEKRKNPEYKKEPGIQKRIRYTKKEKMDIQADRYTFSEKIL